MGNVIEFPIPRSSYLKGYIEVIQEDLIAEGFSAEAIERVTSRLRTFYEEFHPKTGWDYTINLEIPSGEESHPQLLATITTEVTRLCHQIIDDAMSGAVAVVMSVEYEQE